MSDAAQTDQGPQLYLVLPKVIDLVSFPDQLNAVLDHVDVACLRLGLASTDVDHISRTVDGLMPLAHARDLALVIEDHVALVERLGLDGVHLSDGGKSLRALRKDMGDDVILGTFCGGSKHDGMNAAELGTDYVSFGPVGNTQLGSGTRPDLDIFRWWSEMIEVPVVAEGALDVALIEQLAPITDFFAIGEEIWGDDDPVKALESLTAPLRA